MACGTREGGLKYVEETQLSFPLLLDRNRKLYRQFGLRRSLVVAFKLEIFKWYADNLGRDDRLAWPDEEMTTLGGDFVLDSSGKVVYSHCCKEQYDRPAVADILQCLKEC